jgi:antitoxin CcdA
MTVPKRKISVSLDEDLVEELEASGDTVSSQVNQAVRDDLERRRRNRLLGEWLDEMEAEDGPIPQELIDKYMKLLQ